MPTNPITIQLRVRFRWWAKPLLLLAELFQSESTANFVVTRGMILEQETATGWKKVGQVEKTLHE
jgi:hypothetical protein